MVHTSAHDPFVRKRKKEKYNLKSVKVIVKNYFMFIAKHSNKIMKRLKAHFTV